MNEDNGFTMSCPRCGAEMNSNSRYCMKCGYLNPNNEANKNMQQFIKEEKQETYQIGSGKFVINNTISNNVNSQVRTSIANNTGNKLVCFLLNFGIFIAIMLFNLNSILKGSSFSIDLLANSLFPMYAIIVSVIFIYIYSLQLIAVKCNKPWWSMLIPIYNLMVLSEITFKKKWIGLLALIPYVGILVFIAMIYMLGKRFNYNGIITVLLSFIYLPLIAYGSHAYEGYVFVEDNSNKSIERDYKLKKIFLTVVLFFLFVGILLTVKLNMSYIEKGSKSASNYYFVFASKSMVAQTKNVTKNNYFKCSLDEYKNDTGIYYMYFSDISDYIFLPFHLQRETISGYIKIDNTNGVSKYYISLSDGTYGFSETNIDNINKDTVVKYEKLIDLDETKVNVCTKDKSKYLK